MSGTESPRRTPLQELFLGVLLIIVVAAGVILAAWAMRLQEREERLRGLEQGPVRGERVALPHHASGETGPGKVEPTLHPSAPAGEKKRLDDSTVQHLRRLLEVERDRNRAAVQWAKRRLDDKFRGYAERVPLFTDALNSLGEKFRIGKTLVQDSAQGGNETRQEAIRLFAENVVTESGLRADVEEVVARFQRDIRANREMVLTGAGSTLDLPSAPDLAAFANADLVVGEFKEQLAAFLESAANAVPKATVGSLERGVAFEETISRQVTKAVEAHNAGKGAATPDNSKRAETVGTIAGVLAGAADYWLMQSRFESALTNQCRSALEKIRDALWADPHHGLEASFTSYVALVNETHELALKRAAGAP